MFCADMPRSVCAVLITQMVMKDRGICLLKILEDMSKYLPCMRGAASAIDGPKLGSSIGLRTASPKSRPKLLNGFRAAGSDEQAFSSSVQINSRSFEK